MLIASGFITFFEEVWKSTFPGYAKITKLQDIADFLKDSAKTAVKSYLKGEKKLMVKDTVKRNWRSIVTNYFQGVESSDENDFIPPTGFSDIVKERMGLKNLR